MDKYIHNKTGKVYTKTSKDFINATNGKNDGQVMVGYFNSTGTLFVREKFEFYKKFTKLKK